MYRKIRSHIKEYQRKFGKKILDKKKKNIKLDFKDIKKILFIRYDGKIGDYMVSSFIYREIKKQRPDIQIDVIGINKNESLFLKNENIDHFYKLKKTKYRYLYAWAKKLRKENYDILIDPTEVLKNKDLFFIREVNAKVNFGYAKENYKIFNKNIEKNEKHITEVYKMISEELGFKSISTTYDIPIDDISDKEIEKFLKENDAESFIAVNLFGAKKRTKFTYEKSLELLRLILNQRGKSKVILLYSPAEKEILENLVIEINDKNLVYYNKSKTIFDSISIIKRAELVISPDTSIVHIAEGLNKRIITFYTSSDNDFAKWKIRDGNNQVIRCCDVNEVNFNQENLKLN